MVLTNPPFGGKEGKEAQTGFAYKTGATQVLFLQHVIDQPETRRALRHRAGRGRAVPHQRDRLRADQAQAAGLTATCGASSVLPGGVFTAAGAGVKTEPAVLHPKGKPTESVWYYDLSDVKVGKKTPLTLDHFDEFFELLPTRGDSERSWTVTRAAIEAKNYDLKAVNPNRKVEATPVPRRKSWPRSKSGTGKCRKR